MSTRRNAIAALLLGGLAAQHRTAIANPQSNLEFDELLKDALSNVRIISDARQYSEGNADFYDRVVRRAKGPPRLEPSTKRSIGTRARAMIIGFEVSSQVHYEATLTRPVWPNGDSGVTIGIGYDLGYHSFDWFKEDWEGILPDDVIMKLRPACQVKGIAAQKIVKKFTDVSVDWRQALKQFQTTGLPRYVELALLTVPAAQKLSDESLGAIVSLVMNRGASFNNHGVRFAEMNAIRNHLNDGNLTSIPDEIRKMARLWQPPVVTAKAAEELRGLIIRRNLEAKLFELGLSSS